MKAQLKGMGKKAFKPQFLKIDLSMQSSINFDFAHYMLVSIKNETKVWPKNNLETFNTNSKMAIIERCFLYQVY